MSFKVLKTEGNARRGRMETVHGVIETPVFMNVGTSAAIKGGISTADLYDVHYRSCMGLRTRLLFIPR